MFDVRHLGKRPARPGAISFKAATYLAEPHAFPNIPPTFGHYGRGEGLDFGMLANDKFGNCVLAGAAHETMIWTHRSGDGAPAAFSDNSVLSDYAAITGFDPANPATDQGTDMAEAASYRRRTGIIDASGARHKIDAYMALRQGDPDQLALAVYLFGCAGVGLQLPDFSDDQFDHGQPWSVRGVGSNLGGHYAPCVGRNSRGDFIVVTWGRLHAMSREFYMKFSDEAVAYLSPESLRGGKSPEGFDADRLRGDLAALSTS